jgi:4-oxalocrotonate tautomerase
MFTGRSKDQKQLIANDVAAALMSNGIPESAISVSVEDVAPADWIDDVYNPEIRFKSSQIYKKPGYGPDV